jgi:endonuclease YncB( thermonuclease family)
MVLGIALGVLVAKMLSQIPRETWDRVLTRSSGAEERTTAVTKVIDGDTIVIGGDERVRYIGVDAPEFGEPLYEEAKGLQERVVLGSKVRIVPCKEEPKDRYGRTLAFVKKGNVDVGEQLLRQGLARTLFIGPCGGAVAKAYQKVERGAFRGVRGIWSMQDPRRIGHSEAAQHIGSLMSVTGRVAQVHEGPRAFHLNFGQDYRTDFTAVIFRKELSRLIKEGLYPVTEYMGKSVEVTGILKEYNGPEIIVDSADQLVQVR